MEIVRFTDLNIQFDEFKQFTTQHRIYEFSDEEIIQYEFNINGRNYTIKYTDNKIIPEFTTRRLMEQLGFYTKEEFLNYLNNNPNVIKSKIENKPLIVADYFGIPDTNIKKYIWFFLLDNKQIVAYLNAHKTSEYMYLDIVSSIVKRSGFCKVLCSNFMSYLREINEKSLFIESSGGIPAHRCYISSFLINDDGYNYVRITSMRYYKDEIFILNKHKGRNWLRDVCITKECNDDYEMLFYD